MTTLLDSKQINTQLVSHYNRIRLAIRQGTSTEREGHDEMMTLAQELLPGNEFRKLRHRFDHRTIFAFFDDIKRRTLAEKNTIKVFADSLIEQGHTVSYSSTGCDNDGNPIFWGENIGAVDYSVNIDGEDYPIDVKNNPYTDEFCSYKMEDIKRAKDGFLITPTKSGTFVVLTPKSVEALSQTRNVWDWVKFGNKSTLRLVVADLQKLTNFVFPKGVKIQFENELTSAEVERLTTRGLNHAISKGHV